MKIDRSKLKKSSSEVPADCKALIERLTGCAGDRELFLRELQRIETWTYGKCELFHWIDVLDLCDEVLEMAAASEATAGDDPRRAADPAAPWLLSCDAAPSASADPAAANRLKELLLWTLHFTTLLIEHSFSRHLYSSMEHLTVLLASSDLDVVLAVLNLLYMFSKRSNFITRLAPEKRSGLLGRLTHLAASWGGKDNGFGLAKCCSDDPIGTFPESATTLHFEFYAEVASSAATITPGGAHKNGKNQLASTVTVIHLENVDKRMESPAKIMGQILRDYQVPEDKQMLLFTYLRLAASFSDYSKRLKCVQARLQALSVLIYSNQLTDNVQNLLYPGLLEELVEVLEMKGDHLMEIKAAALKALTSIIHLDRNPNFPKLNTIIDVTGAGSFHGFLPVLVRSCIASLTGGQSDAETSASTSFPQPLATALFSFLYHLASYEAGGEALVNCGMMESLLKVIQWPSTELDHITFVTRAVRVIDLITNLDMQSFQSHSGLTVFISRLELEVNHCRQQQPFEIRVRSDRKDSLADALEQQATEEMAASVSTNQQGEAHQVSMELDAQVDTSRLKEEEPQQLTAPKTGVTCLPQRAALLKSMLNFLKKAIQDSTFSDNIRHVMDLSLPASLKHIISNAEYYGPSLFLLATDVVTAFVFQEPSLLSSLQDKGLTDVVLHALLVKDVPATREVLGSLPNVFSALCLNTRGLNAFVACKPFERLFKVLLSPDYLPAMRRRRSSDPMGDTASNLGNAMDELMRHQPSLKTAATGAIIKLLEEVCALGRDSKYICWKSHGKPEPATVPPAGPPPAGNEGGSSDEEDEEEEEGSANQTAQEQTGQTEAAPAASSIPASQAEKEPVPLVDYIHNVMKFVDAILSNNSTDDHCREFVQQKGLVPLMGILGLPNLPIDFPAHQACQSVAAVAKSVLTLAHEPQVLKQGLLHLNEVLKSLEPLHKPLEPPGGSVLLRELVSSPVISEATANPQATPLLHFMSSAHAYIQMFVHVCRTGQSDIRSLSINHWGSELGLTVLKGLSRLYTSLVWESTVLLALCSEDTLPPSCDFGKGDMDKLLPPSLAAIAAAAAAPSASSGTVASNTAAASQATIELRGGGTENEETFSPASGTSADSNSSVTAAMENLSTDPEVGMDVDSGSATAAAAAAAGGASTGTSSANGASERTATSGEKVKDKSNPALHYQIKQIKPLLSGSSRLGRALAELFALLVKLCVGSPLRQRRGQQIPTAPAPPSAPARAVASALTKLLASGLSWEPPPTSPVPRFRLTFFICSVGFTAPMLFDEKKFPYHLMLMKFISSGGQEAFFKTFDWALSCGGKVAPEDGLEHPDLPDGTGEFLDSWLLLLEKMVNPKMVLESPHTLPAKATGNFRPFDPIKYLARTHKLAFLAVMKLWGKRPLKAYGARMTESVLSILCHILKGEKMISEKMEKKDVEVAAKQMPAAAASAAALPAGFPATADNQSSGSAVQRLQPLPDPAEPEINQEHLDTLMEMGFPRERCVEAMRTTGSLDQATDYLLNNPIPPLQSVLENVAAAGGVGAAGLAGHLRAAAAEIAGGEQDELMRAIAMSLGENVVVSSGEGAQESAEAKREEQEEEERLEKEDFEALDKGVIDQFTENTLSGCLGLLDTLPDTVYRVCDLLLAVFARNGQGFKEKVLRALIQEVITSLSTLTTRASAASDPVAMVEELCSGSDALRASARIHLFTLLFEDCSILCAKIVDESRAVADMTRLLTTVQEVMRRAKQTLGNHAAIETPKWMTPMLLFIDLHEKIILGMNRRSRLATICTHSWKWFDISSGKWCAYAEGNNKSIDDAFWAGESSVKITNGRRKYTIQFGTMMQANEETGNRRPVMISVRDKNEVSPNIKAQTGPSAASIPSTTSGIILGAPQATSTPMEESPPGADGQTTSEPSPPSVPVSSAADGGAADAKTTIPTLDGLSTAERTALLKACVGLVAVPVDPDALNAVLRLCLRLTQLGGVKMLLDLTQASNFTGFASLATLLIRHVMEDPVTLRHTMEKVIRSATMSNNSPNTKELHYMLRTLAPAACRCPEVFASVSKDLLRVDFSLLIKRGGDLEGDDQRLLLKSLPPKPSSAAPTSQVAANPTPALPDVSHSVIHDLLNFLVIPDSDEKPQEEAVAKPESLSHSGSSSSVSASAQPSSSSGPSNRTQSSVRNIVRNSSSGELIVPPTENVIPGSTSDAPANETVTRQTSTSAQKDAPKGCTKASADEKTRKPLLTKSVICRLLAELVKSYSACAKLITDHVYEAGISDLIREDTSALAFLLDELLISKADKDVGQLVKTLVAALASCNHQPEAQSALVSEVKSALGRALAWPESNIKHTKIQALTTLVSTMIESCPPASPSNSSSLAMFKQQQYNMNSMVKILLKRGIVSDLARVPHSLDLSSPNVAASVNAALKPLEILTRIVNTPTAAPPRVATKGKGSAAVQSNEASNNESQSARVNAAQGQFEPSGGVGTNTTNSEATRAQGDETVEPDPEATEHDVSTAAESIDPNSESQLQTVEEGNDEDFEEMMDQLLDRDGAPEPPMLDVIEHSINESGYEVDDTQHDSQMMTQDESQFEAQAMSQDEDQESESSSDSSAATEENEDEDMEEEDENEDEEEDEEGDDDEEDEDEEGASPFDEEDNEFQDVDDTIYRFPLGDNDDDIDLMIHYPDSDAHLSMDVDRSRAMQLPMWSDVNGGAGVDGIGGGTASAGGHVAATHPLLSRQSGADTAAATRTNTRSLQRHRGGGIRIHLNARGGDGPNAIGTTAANAPAILQNLFGSRAEVGSHGLRRGGPLLVDFGFALLDQLGIDSDLNDLDGGNSVLGGAGGVRAALSSIPSALIRWSEESRVIDGESVHDCVTALKPSILEVVEKHRQEELADRRAKKKKLDEEAAKKKEEEAKKKAEEEQAAAASSVNAPKIQVSDSDSAAASVADNESNVATAGSEGDGSVPVLATAGLETGGDDGMQSPITATAARVAEGLAAAISQNYQITSDNATSTPISAEPQASIFTPVSSAASSSDQLPAALGPLSPLPEDSQDRRLADEDAVMETPAEPGSIQQEDLDITEAQEHTAMEVATSVLREEEVTEQGTQDVPQAAQAGEESQEPQPGTSGTAQAVARNGPNYSEILGIDVSELPEDVDPSFLAALPEEMRQEIIDDQRRRRRAAQQAQTTNEGMAEVSPEFLAALPPNIQEEVLAHQRMEAQRRAAVTSNPDAPVDPGEFLSNLPAPLRQSVLADLEDSQMAALPADMAAEAATLRREYDLRNHRAMMHDRFFSQATGGTGATLSSILRNAHRLTGSYHVIGGLGNGSRDGWRSFRTGVGSSAFPASLLASTHSKFKGRQLLDNEGLSCLLILLFIDDPKINTTRLHRILKYLSYHPPTRDWIVHSLLSILDKSNDKTAESGGSQQHSSSSAPGGFDTPPAKIRKSTSKSSAPVEGRESAKSSGGQQQNNWLNISMDAALGFRANVFQVTRSSGGKKSGSSNDKVASLISIHSGASTTVCRHTLEVLISLAKSFPAYFLPWKENDLPKPKDETLSKSKGGKSESAKKTDSSGADFWETLLKLDQMSGASSKKGKSVVRSHSNVSNFRGSDDDDDKKSSSSFESSIFGQLLSMLSSSVIRRNSVLTDKLLRLLSIISVGQPDLNKKPAPEAEDGKKDAQAQSPSSISSDHLKLAVEVLTSKACSEEGLEDVNALLLNLSYGPAPTRDTILRLLLEGAQELGSVVRQNVLDLQAELRKLKSAAAEESASTSSGEPQKQQSSAKGLLMDRFTNDHVVLTAPSKVKGGPELQLPSMNALTSKTSSQAFFLRVLKVIIQLRESALLAMKKPTKPASTQSTQAPNAQNASGVTPPPGEESNAAESMDVEENTGEKEKKSSADENTSKEAAAPEPETAECLDSLSDQLKLEQLWEALSSCLKDLADTPDHHAVLVLQATVEAFFLVHAAATQPDEKKKVQLKETRSEQLAHIQDQLEAPFQPQKTGSSGPSSLNAAAPATSSSGQQLSRDTEKFLSFAETHRTVLNQILRQSTVHLADGPFSVLVDHTRVLDFDIKRRYFRAELERLDEGMRREDLAVHVKRDNVFEDSFRELHRRSPEEWKNRFYIVFEGEEGQDAGGLLREWYVIISREIFNPMYALFKNSPGDRVTYMIQEHSHTNPNHLDYFKFVGRVIAKAIYDNKLLECYFSRSFYKHILAKHVKYQDMESEDYAFFKGLEFLLSNDVQDLGYDLTFSLEVREFGVTEVRDLIPNGRNTKVTEENKHEYAHRVCQMKMTGAVRKQLAAFLEGFYNIIPRRLISIFNEQELELLLSGLPTIDVDDLKANTEYHKYHANSLQIVWFWRALRSFDQTDKAKFMQFVTGSSKVPLQGFSALEGMNGPQKFQIHRDDRSTDRLPSAHTCFNQLDLPAYETYDKLRTYLLKAVQECSEGFGFA